MSRRPRTIISSSPAWMRKRPRRLRPRRHRLPCLRNLQSLRFGRGGDVAQDVIEDQAALRGERDERFIAPEMARLDKPVDSCPIDYIGQSEPLRDRGGVDAFAKAKAHHERFVCRLYC